MTIKRGDESGYINRETMEFVSASKGVSEAAPDLKPCPFCGARAGKRDLDGIVEAEGHERYMIACALCLIAQSGNTWEEAAEKWNARVHQPPEQNSEDKNSVSGASDSSTSRIPKDNLVSADLGVSRAVAAKLLALREMIARSEGFSRDGSGVAEAWHILYSIADPNFESLTPWAALEALAGQHSTSDVLGNPDRGTSVRSQPESSESESTLVTEVSKEQDNAKS